MNTASLVVRTQLSRKNAFAVLSILCLAISAAAQSSIFAIQPSPSPNVQGDTLLAVTAVSSTDAWAVGYQNDNNLNDSRTLTMHWNGTAWKIVPSPNPGSTPNCQSANTGNVLNSISPIASNDIWAAGFSFDCTTAELKPMVIHWNGSAWQVAPTPKLRTNDNSSFNGILALATDNVYAVGYTPAANGEVLSLIEHWNGQAWSIVPSPNVKNHGNILFSITANSPTDMWAVGSKTAPNVPVETLALHFNGSKWSIVPTPNVVTTGDLNQNTLLSARANAANDVTAVGFVLDGDNQREITLIEHWDGSKWSVVSSPNQSGAPGSANTLTSLTVLSPTNMYAAGFFADQASVAQQQTLALHFDGTQWSIISSPVKGLAQQLNGIFGLPGTGDIWTVGGWAQNGTDPETGLLILPKTLVLFSPKG